MNDPTGPSLKVPPLQDPVSQELQQHSSNFIMFLPHNFRSPDIGPPNLEICVLPAQLRGTRAIIKSTASLGAGITELH
ncbi:hypothetical protein CEXT_546011 [Caerostris extrusa]|uniref:Uncharacterized protein n=1 Tax=Caerostris extrusa TaxID=172846 RepID=A0AAV4MVC2_CAEEX|nr:hypothetical protein CEXT_546011 [Caerostris extrusa]